MTEDIIPTPCNTRPIQIHVIDPPLNPTVIQPLNNGMHSKMIVGRRPSQLDSNPVINDPPNCPKLLKLARIEKIPVGYEIKFYMISAVWFIFIRKAATKAIFIYLSKKILLIYRNQENLLQRVGE